MSNLSINPSKLEIQLKPGATYIQSYTVTNQDDRQIILNTSVDSWTPQGPNGNIVYLNSLPPLELSLSNSNISLGQSFVLNPKQSQQLVLKIKVPPDISPGDNYFTFFINQQNQPINSTNSNQLIRLGSHLLISVSDSELPLSKLNIKNLKVNSIFNDSFFSYIKISGEIVNNSNFYSRIDTSLNIFKNNQVIKKIIVYPDNVLANHSRQLRCLDNKSPVTCQIQKPLWPGLYTINIYNQNIHFFIFPYSLLLSIVTLIFIIKLLVDKHK